MKKIIIIGSIGSGKTTLIQSLKKINTKYKKTQALEYYGNIIDTPGEYLENRRYYNALTIASYDCDEIALIQDSSNKRCVFPPNFASIFTKPVIGIVTKIDKEDIYIDNSIKCLKLAGAQKIFKVSSKEDIGIKDIQNYIND